LATRLRIPAAVLFDLDGTLVDSLGDLAAAVNSTLVHLGLDPLAEEVVRGFVGDGAGRLVERALGSRTDLLERALPFFRETYAAGCTQRTRPLPGVPALLDRLSGTPMAVVSNKPSSYCAPILAATGLARHFRAVLGGDDATALKPSPRLLLEALRILEVAPGRAVMVGDGIQDLRAASAAGIRYLGMAGLTPYHALREAGAGRVFLSAAELGSFLAGCGDGPGS
jgi:phosphoglycolate phosphatase